MLLENHGFYYDADQENWLYDHFAFVRAYAAVHDPQFDELPLDRPLPAHMNVR